MSDHPRTIQAYAALLAKTRQIRSLRSTSWPDA